MSYPCNCCRGISVLTPLDLTNRPGLNSLAYRIGTYSAFFETMKARLSSRGFEFALGFQPLKALTTRSADDPAIALLDTWAIVADVLTFYQERIVNEGYLRTATEKQSLNNLAALVGYVPRPGLSASVFLGYTLEQDSSVTISTGSRVQTIPGPGELPRTFEISDDLDAGGEWNNLVPRLTRPQVISEESAQFYVAGVTPNLKANDPVLIVTDPSKAPSRVLRVASTEIDVPHSRTKVMMLSAAKAVKAAVAPALAQANVIQRTSDRSFMGAVNLVRPLSKAPAEHPSTPAQLPRSVNDTFQLDTDTTPALLEAFNPGLGDRLYVGLKNVQVTPTPPGEFHALRVQAAPLGHNAPLRPITNDKGVVVATEEWPLIGSVSIRISISTLSFTGIEGAGAKRFARLFDFEAQNVTALVQVSSAGVTGSTAVPIPTKEEKPHNVGPWKLDVGPGSTALGARFKFPQLGHSYDVEFNQDSNSLSVLVDGVPSAIQVPLGQSSVTSSAGRRTVVSFDRSALVDDEVAVAPADPADTTVLSLDMIYDQILPGSWVAIERIGNATPVIAKVQNVQKVSITRYGIANRVTQLTLDRNWLDPETDLMLDAVRNTTVSAQSEQLDLAEEPISDPVPADRKEKTNEIELGDLYGGLKSGRWLVVQGERVDNGIPPGVTGSELVMLANVRQGVQQLKGTDGATQDLPGDSTHSFLVLSSPLSYQYKRDTVTVYGNVVRATHGESRKEVLGSGDGSQELQQFSLHQSPVTYLPASNTDGAQSTLQVKVNDLLWREVDSLASTGPKDRVYTTQADAKGQRTITFGNGRNGMRLPTGQANVIAYYRAGLGSGGNVDAGRISQLATRPLGVKAVVNPIPASGGADSESTEQTRRNTPVGVVALARLVSISDYVDFARTFAGIGKASAQSISDGGHKVVFVTIAGAGGTVIQENSALPESLLQAMEQLGDPNLPVQIGICEFMLLVISAQVIVQSGFDFTAVSAQIRSTLLDDFGYDRQELAESVPLSRVIATIQGVDGVQAVTVQVFDTISESDTASADVLKAKLKEISTAKAPRSNIVVPPAELNPTTGRIDPAAVAFLNPDLPDTLILTEISL